MPAADLTGHVLDDRYRVIEAIGEGAMGSVYRAERLKLGRFVAIKVLNEAIPNDASRRRFEREAKAMARLEHPNCGSVLDVGVYDDRPYVVMELVSGQNLKALLANGALPIPRAVEITRQLLSGLAHAHELGIIHRDVKPANIVLSQKAGVGDHAKLLDFGLARLDEDTGNLTGALVLGTPSYMAPEQIQGRAIDHRVDLYSSGVLLFELLTATKPYQADDPLAICMQHLTFPIPRLADHAPGRDFGPLEDVVARALAKDAADRFASAADFSRALVDAGKQLAAAPPTASQSAQTVRFDSAPILAQTSALTVGAKPAPAPAPAPTPAPTPTPAPRPRARRRVVVAALAGCAVVAVTVGVVLATGSTAPSPQAAAARPAPLPAPHPAPPQPVPPAVAPSPSPADPVADILARAAELTGAGRPDAAMRLLTGARKTYPKDARLPYQASIVSLERMWWADGLKYARAALALDASYKTDADLIKLVVRGFNTTAGYDWTLAHFLHDDIGPAAKPFLEETATGHPNPIVRKRAAAELKRYR